MLMPAHARKVILWNEPQPLFARQNVEAHLDAMLQPTVQLRSGGYLVINQTEALVAIDVNSGRSTRERGIEETALKTNLEAADEVARQLRLRDLAGLIVIDFIDMESRRNNAAVEKRMKDALKDDRARIQIGAISHFGLMELSRQRLRPSLAETSFTTCPHCGGTGLIRTTETARPGGAARGGGGRRQAPGGRHPGARRRLGRALRAEPQAGRGWRRSRRGTAWGVSFAADDTLMPPQVRIDRLRPQVNEALPAPTAIPINPSTPRGGRPGGRGGGCGRRRGERRSRHGTGASQRDRRGRRGAQPQAPPAAAAAGAREEGASVAAQAGEDPRAGRTALTRPRCPRSARGNRPWRKPAEGKAAEPAAEGAEPLADEDGRARRRGTARGGRRRRREPEGEVAAAEPNAEAPSSFDEAPTYTGPTPSRPVSARSTTSSTSWTSRSRSRHLPLPRRRRSHPPAAVPMDRPAEEAEMGGGYRASRGHGRRCPCHRGGRGATAERACRTSRRRPRPRPVSAPVSPADPGGRSRTRCGEEGGVGGGVSAVAEGDRMADLPLPLAGEGRGEGGAARINLDRSTSFLVGRPPSPCPLPPAGEGSRGGVAKCHPAFWVEVRRARPCNGAPHPTLSQGERAFIGRPTVRGRSLSTRCVEPRAVDEVAQPVRRPGRYPPVAAGTATPGRPGDRKPSGGSRSARRRRRGRTPGWPCTDTAVSS